jgi:hypothetical protein
MPRKSQKAASKSLYSVHPGVAMVQKWIVDLPAKTGKTLEQWLQLIKEQGPPTERERREWLKKEYNLGTNTAWWLAERAVGKDTWDDDPEAYLKQAVVYVEEMFAGTKAALRPIYDELLRLGLSLGEDVKACPCKTIVPLYRRFVFAQIKPATQKRIDLGLSLREIRATGRLIDTGGLAKGDRITHRIPITSLAEIDDEVKQWLKAAYDADA